jgi:hypothetical protein
METEKNYSGASVCTESREKKKREKAGGQNEEKGKRWRQG